MYNSYVHNILVLFDPSVERADGSLKMEDAIPLLKGRTTGAKDGKPTIYICENYACKTPVTDVRLLREALSDD